MNSAGVLSAERNTNVSFSIEIWSAATPASPKRSTTFDSTPQRTGLTKPSGGGGENAALIFSSCETNDVSSFGIQLPITIRPPGFVTLTISRATANGLGADIAPKQVSVRSNEWSATP